MKIEVDLNKNLEETKIVIHTNQMNEEIKEIIELLEQKQKNEKNIIGILDGNVYILEKNEIESFYTENAIVYARKENLQYKIKKKLYELEQLLKGTTFVRISKSEIVNFDKVECLNMESSIVVSLKFKSGKTTYVSRRYIKKIKKYLCI